MNTAKAVEQPIVLIRWFISHREVVIISIEHSRTVHN
jgi:hypothetical protein